MLSAPEHEGAIVATPQGLPAHGGTIFLRLLRGWEAVGVVVQVSIDFAVISAGWWLSPWILRWTGLGSTALQARTSELPFLLAVTLMVTVSFLIMGLYRLERFGDALSPLVRSVKAITGLGLGALAAHFCWAGFYPQLFQERMLLLTFYLFLVIALGLERTLLLALGRAFWRRRRFLQRVLLVGEPHLTSQLAEAIEREPRGGYHVCDTLVWQDETQPFGADPSVFSSEILPSFRQRLARQSPRGVLFIVEQRSFQPYAPLLLAALEQGLELQIVTRSDILPLLGGRTGEICGWPTVLLTRAPLYVLQRAMKRSLDLLLAGSGLLLTLPLIMVLGLIIRRQDRGPAFFFQTRAGRRGQTFRMIKLRTMTVDAPPAREANIAEGPLTRVLDDPRVTPLGGLLRRHKLDELPQFWNVLCGQMSLVGPRPPILDEVAHYSFWQRERLAVTPGLTGLWQIQKVRKWRFDEMVTLDLQYIFHWSLLMDLRILLRTVWVVLRGN
jgi:exopolysaccharide biosynthesis polyprenyl glycosylphosphotransferase